MSTPLRNDTPPTSPSPFSPFLDGRPKRLLIGGQWVEAGAGLWYAYGLVVGCYVSVRFLRVPPRGRSGWEV